MTSRDHERFRRQLEEQLRADAQLLYAAYCAKLNAYETLHQLQGGLGDLDPRLLLPADLPLRLPPGPPAPAASAPAPAPRRRRKVNELYNAVHAALDQLPEVFDRGDICALLGYEPHRASLYGVLRSLVEGGWIAREEQGVGPVSNRYRKL
jgi:hypothetical protein